MLYIGIDVAKRSHVAAAMGDGGEVAVEPFEFRNTQKGFERLLERLARRGVSAEGSLAGMEATGHYWVALFDFLAANGFEVAVINPIQTDAWRRVDTVRPAKTDGIDALLIADLLRCKRFEPSALGDEATEELRQLARYRFELVQELTALKNRATAILDRVFPEYERLFADKFGPTSSALLKECATPADVLAADPKALAGLLAGASRGRLGRERADEVVEAARSSVGVSFGSRALAFELRVLVERMEFTRGQISELEAEIARALSETAGRHLTSIPGVGPALAALIAGEVGDAARFETPSKLVAYAGMDATRRVSGESCVSSTSRFTKQHPFVSHVSVKILHARASPWHQSFLLLQLPAHERVFDPVRLPVVGDEPAVVDDAVHHRLGHVVVGKDLAPSGELDVGGEDERDPLVAHRHHPEQKPCPVGIGGKVPPLVQDDEVAPAPSNPFLGRIRF